MEKTLVILDPVLKKGFTALPNAVLSSRLISLAAKAMYGILLMFAWQDNECFPGQERLAAVGNCSERSVRNYLTELKEAGYISWRQRGLNETNIYYINDLASVQTPEALNNKDRQNLPVKTGKQQEAVETSSHPENASPPESLEPQGPELSAGPDRQAGPEHISGPDRQNVPPKKTQVYNTCLSSLRSDKQQAGGGPGGSAEASTGEAATEPRAADHATEPIPAAGPPEENPPSGSVPATPPTNAALIGELGDRYRAVVPPERQQRGDYSFIGRLYNEYGHSEVLLGINDMAYQIEAGQVPENPLVYLRGILARRLKGDDRPKQPDPGANTGKPSEGRKPSKYPTRRIINGKEYYY